MQWQGIPDINDSFSKKMWTDLNVTDLYQIHTTKRLVTYMRMRCKDTDFSASVAA